jgi:hypothetical protein
MKFKNYLITEDAVSKALDLPEPDVGGDYPQEKVERYIKIIDSAMEAMTKKEESEANDAIVADLRDKKKKWENVKKETKPVKTKLEVPPGEEEGGGPPPPQAEEEPPPEKKKQEENTILRLLKKCFKSGFISINDCFFPNRFKKQSYFFDKEFINHRIWIILNNLSNSLGHSLKVIVFMLYGFFLAYITFALTPS